MEKPTLSDSAMYYLAEARRWAKIISIFGFIFCGLLILLGIFMGFVMSMASEIAHQSLPFPPSFLTFFYIVIAIVYFFPIYYLFKFSEDLKFALEMGHEEQLTSAFRWLKSHYKFIGILLIIFTGLGILTFFASIMAGIFGFFATTGL